ncbi:hypothetical protein GE21DRAFT_7004 [Neurospora crassa]|uniref:Uncharacterized protein n=1 Tax=Neurospora crassa (strain ATCC 24698 / 74-OR23-1A / CBS 708.71 / DSM 1257 / FGSC 987) TaxID=367110 RepID=V5ILV6_NEUCR|nr:hypothetical protein NCU16939 [Neurospora crassa OR74A]ESA42380.1 hypothetical protein NCU16939 [Neurospora crassa OR74A]KHE79266.1 hypothetical protein GE21DRAFT_7004 [Neurospora crassa]|eukprot:XP_011394812.1 hypothetical protein NCU16939 [Neurospora crassa OR74A]
MIGSGTLILSLLNPPPTFTAETASSILRATSYFFKKPFTYRPPLSNQLLHRRNHHCNRVQHRSQPQSHPSLCSSRLQPQDPTIAVRNLKKALTPESLSCLCLCFRSQPQHVVFNAIHILKLIGLKVDM